jgi:hypothetical protein
MYTSTLGRGRREGAGGTRLRPYQQHRPAPCQEHGEAAARERGATTNITASPAQPQQRAGRHLRASPAPEATSPTLSGATASTSKGRTPHPHLPRRPPEEGTRATKPLLGQIWPWIATTVHHLQLRQLHDLVAARSRPTSATPTGQSPPCYPALG